MKIGILPRIAACGLATAPLLASCIPSPCLEQSLEPETQYKVTLLELYDENTSLALWDPAVPTNADLGCELDVEALRSFIVTTVEERSLSYPGSCTSWVLNVDEIEGVSNLVNEHSGVYAGDFGAPYLSLGGGATEFEYQGCEMRLDIALAAPADGEPGASLDPSEIPPLLVYTEASMSTSSGCVEQYKDCFQYWVASIERLP